MTAEQHRTGDHVFEIRTVLALVDFSPCTPLVEEVAISLAARYGARLCFVHVEPPEPDFVGYRPGPQTVRNGLAGEWRKEHALVQEIGKRARDAGIEVLARQVQGPSVESIVTEALRLHADLIVAEFRRHGALYRFAFGDNLRELAEKLSCPLLLVPAPSPEGG